MAHHPLNDPGRNPRRVRQSRHLASERMEVEVKPRRVLIGYAGRFQVSPNHRRAFIVGQGEDRLARLEGLDIDFEVRRQLSGNRQCDRLAVLGVGLRGW